MTTNRLLIWILVVGVAVVVLGFGPDIYGEYQRRLNPGSQIQTTDPVGWVCGDLNGYRVCRSPKPIK